MRMPHIAICGLSGCTVSPFYPIYGAIIGKNLLNIKCVLIFLYKLFPKHFSFGKEFSEMLTKIYIRRYAKYPFCFSDFNKNWIFYGKIFGKYQLSRKSVYQRSWKPYINFHENPYIDFHENPYINFHENSYINYHENPYINFHENPYINFHYNPYSNFHENSSSGSWVVTCGRTDTNDGANRRPSQFTKSAWNESSASLKRITGTCI